MLIQLLALFWWKIITKQEFDPEHNFSWGALWDADMSDSLPVWVGERPAWRPLRARWWWGWWRWGAVLELLKDVGGFCSGLRAAGRYVRTRVWVSFTENLLARLDHRCPAWWQRCPAIGRDQEGTSSPSLRDCCFSSEECPHGRPAAWPRVTGCMRRNNVQWLCRGEVIMTSYQELTAAGESSPLFTGCCRAKEVISRDLGGRTYPERGNLTEEGKLELEVASGFNSPRPPYLTFFDSLPLCTSSDSPPPPPTLCEPLEDFSTPACPHSSRVPWRRREQGQGAPGREHCASSNSARPFFGSLTEQIQICCHNSPEIHVAVGSSANVADMDERRKTFEWMRVKRSQHRAGKFMSRKTEHEK